MSTITPEAILSYPNLFTPSAAVEGAEERYSVTLLFEEDTDIRELKRTIIKAAQEKFGDKLAGAEIESIMTEHGPANFLVAGNFRVRLPWRDDPEWVEEKGYPEGVAAFNVKSKDPVPVVSRIPDPSNDDKPAPIVNLNGDIRYKDGNVAQGARPIYAGCRGRASVNPYVYDKPNNGVSLWFSSGLQITGDGERLDGRASPENEFDADMDAAADLSDLTGDGEEPAAVGAGDEDDLSDLIG